MLFTGLGRSVLGKTVPSVSSTALGLRPRAVLETRPRAQFFPIRTSRPVNNIYISITVNTTYSAYGTILHYISITLFTEW